MKRILSLFAVLFFLSLPLSAKAYNDDREHCEFKLLEIEMMNREAAKARGNGDTARAREFERLSKEISQEFVYEACDVVLWN